MNNKSRKVELEKFADELMAAMKSLSDKFGLLSFVEKDRDNIVNDLSGLEIELLRDIMEDPEGKIAIAVNLVTMYSLPEMIEAVVISDEEFDGSFSEAIEQELLPEAPKKRPSKKKQTTH
jgi:hypothetical protein